MWAYRRSARDELMQQMFSWLTFCNGNQARPVRCVRIATAHAGMQVCGTRTSTTTHVIRRYRMGMVLEARNCVTWHTTATTVTKPHATSHENPHTYSGRGGIVGRPNHQLLSLYRDEQRPQEHVRVHQLTARTVWYQHVHIRTHSSTWCQCGMPSRTTHRHVYAHMSAWKRCAGSCSSATTAW